MAILIIIAPVVKHRTIPATKPTSVATTKGSILPPTTPLHHYTITSVHHQTTPLLVPLQHCTTNDYTTTPLHHYTARRLYSYTATLLHHLHRCNATTLPRTTAPLHHCTTARLHHCTSAPVPQHSAASLPGCPFAFVTCESPSGASPAVVLQVTMTTVGYGDFAPQSLPGYITVSFLSVAAHYAFDKLQAPTEP